MAASSSGRISKGSTGPSTVLHPTKKGSTKKERGGRRTLNNTQTHPTSAKRRSASTMTTATALIKSGNTTLTPFQTRVYLALCEVPEGKVTTYKYLSNAIGCGSSQAVGQALKRNPYAPTVPCHRVIQSDLSMGGFGGTRFGEKIDKKIHLLESEGVVFREDGCVDPTCIYMYS